MTTRVLIPIAAALVAMPVQTSAAPTDDWSAWYGCWRAVDSAAGATPLVCVLPGEDAMSVRIATIEDGAIADELVVRADGVARPIEDGGCEGSERAFFSDDGRRIFTRAELACNGLGRVSTGVLAMLSEAEWVDAQALTVNGQHAARTIRYRAVDASEVPSWVAMALPQDEQLAQQTARLDASSPLGIDEVIEASQHIAAPALEALLAERQQGFGLSADKLARLAKQGVAPSTIDVMVALSYPAKFAVAPQRARAGGDEEWMDERNAARSYMEDCYDPFTSARRYGCYNGRYGYGYSRGGMYGYSPYGYDPYGWNYSSRPVIVIVQGDDEREPRGGQVVKGRGYTRSGATRGTAAPRTDPATTTSAGRSTTTTASPPSSSTGSSSTPKRTAKKRGGGGDR